MKKTLILLAILSINLTNIFAQNKRAEDLTAVSNYFTLKSSSGPFMEFEPKKEARKRNKWLPTKTCYAVYVQTFEHSGAISAIVVLSKENNLKYRKEIKYFRQDSPDKNGKRGYIIVYKNMKGDPPKQAPLFEF